MHASIRRAQVIPGKMSEFTQILRDEIAPRHSQIKGFVAYYAIETGNDGILGISLFENQTAAEEATSKAKEYVTSRLQPLLQTPVEFSTGNVIVEKTLQRV